jgi:hypothetical protein
MLQLRDGSILVHHDNTRDWYKLTPDIKGNYATGTWKVVAPMPVNYGPLYYASAVLPDGHVIVEGGEYNLGSGTIWTNFGATYDPVVDLWISLAPPPGWANIGDAQSVLLDDGTWMLANSTTSENALFHFRSLTWTTTGSSIGTNDEQGWTKLPDGTVLTVNAFSACGTSTSTEIYDPRTGTWSCGPQTPMQLWASPDHELGAAVLDYQGLGQVLQFGGNVQATALYDYYSNTWTAGPVPPNSLDQADGPAALEPNGKVLALLSPGKFQTGCQFIEYDPITNAFSLAPNPV